MPTPAIPTNFQVQTGNGQNWITWNPSAGANGYPLNRSTDGVNYTQIQDFPGNVFSYLDTNVTLGTTYWYQVAAQTSGTGFDFISPYVSAGPVVPTLIGQNSLNDLRLRSKQRADMVNSNFVTDSEWNYYINKSAEELYDLLILRYEDYYVSPRLQVIQDPNTLMYPIPNGQNYNGAPALYKLYGVDAGIQDATNPTAGFTSLKKFSFIERNRYVFPQLTNSFLGIFNLEYRLIGQNLMLIPYPSSNQIIGIYYFPRIKWLLQDTDILDGISGWDEYIIIDAARKALMKQNLDTTMLMQEKLMMKQRIEDAASNRDAGMPEKISPSRNWTDRNGSFGGFGDGSFGGY